VPTYYFEPEGPDWDYQDVDGIDLPNDAEALVYGHKILRELKVDDQVSQRTDYLLVKNFARKTIFRIPFK
jgi:hypothetical protein